MFRMSPFLLRRFALARDKPRLLKSRVNREVDARFCAGLGVKFPGALDRNPEICLPDARSAPRQSASTLIVSSQDYSSALPVAPT